MRSYVNSNLVKGEKVLYEAHYHWSIWIGPVILIIIGLLACIAEPNGRAFGFSRADFRLFMNFMRFYLIGFGFICLIITYIKYVTDEVAVTTQRLITKTGIIRRTTLELNLRKVETVSVSQGIWDRLLGSGTLEYRGTGGTLNRIPNIEKPYEFRKAFQDALDKYSSNNIEEIVTQETPARDTISAQNVSHATSSATDIAARLYQLKELLDSGILTQEEFESEKTKILNHPV